MHPDLPSTHLGHTPEMTPAGMVYNGMCATHQAQRRGVKRSAGPYTGLFYRILWQQNWECGWSQF